MTLPFFTGPVRGLATAALAVVFLTAHGARAEVVDWKKLKGWDVSFYPRSEGCQAFALFNDQTAFFIGFDNVDDQLAVDITLLDESWASIEADQEYTIQVQFGTESPWTLEMDGVVMRGYPGLTMMIDAQSDEAGLLIEEFRRESSMEWSYKSTSLGKYTLRGSRAAFDEVIACQEAYLEALSSQSGAFAAGNPAPPTDPFAE